VQGVALLLRPWHDAEKGSSRSARVSVGGYSSLLALRLLMPPLRAVRLAAQISGAPRNTLYALALKKKPGDTVS
jgi:hypothetical protein